MQPLDHGDRIGGDRRAPVGQRQPSDREQETGSRRERRGGQPDLLASLLATALSSFGPANGPARADRSQPFADARLFFELNDTDGDLGLHAEIDGEAWTSLEIEGPHDRTLLDIVSRGPLRRQGLTQLAFESAEPAFDELDPADFFRRFPEGHYEIEGRAQGGGTLVSTSFLSQVMAAPPGNVLVSGILAAESCDAPVLPKVAAPVIIRWDPVTGSHPAIGREGPVEVERYQLFVEREGVKLSLDLPPAVTEFEVPRAITDLGDEFKFEIIVRTSTGNNTAVASCFEMY